MGLFRSVSFDDLDLMNSAHLPSRNAVLLFRVGLKNCTNCSKENWANLGFLSQSSYLEICDDCGADVVILVEYRLAWDPLPLPPTALNTNF